MVAEQRVPPGIRRLQPGLPSSCGSRIARRGAGRRSALFSQNAPVPTPEDRLAGALERSTTTRPPRTTQPGPRPRHRAAGSWVARASGVRTASLQLRLGKDGPVAGGKGGAGARAQEEKEGRPRPEIKAGQRQPSGGPQDRAGARPLVAQWAQESAPSLGARPLSPTPPLPRRVPTAAAQYLHLP